MGVRMDLTYFWNSNDDMLWEEKLEEYWRFVKPENLVLEKEMERLNSEIVKGMLINEFYYFLYHEYFVWKYTAKNRLTTTRNSLRKYIIQNKLDELKAIHHEIFSFDLENAAEGITIAQKIHGLGTAGASGLLSLLFPNYFGTVDQYVVKALQLVENLPQKSIIMRISPVGIKSHEGALLVQIMREKATALNAANHSLLWTARKVDMVLWASRQSFWHNHSR